MKNDENDSSKIISFCCIVFNVFFVRISAFLCSRTRVLDSSPESGNPVFDYWKSLQN